LIKENNTKTRDLIQFI